MRLLVLLSILPRAAFRPRHVSLYPEREKKTEDVAQLNFLFYTTLKRTCSQRDKTQKKKNKNREKVRLLLRSLRVSISCARDVTNGNDNIL